MLERGKKNGKYVAQLLLLVLARMLSFPYSPCCVTHLCSPSFPHFPGRPLVQLVLFFPPFLSAHKQEEAILSPSSARGHTTERESHHWSGLGWMQTHIEGGVRAFNQRFSVCLTVGHILCPRRRRASPPIPERKEALLSVCQLPALVLAEGGEGEKRTLGIFIPERKEVPFVCDPSLP